MNDQRSNREPLAGPGIRTTLDVIANAIGISSQMVSKIEKQALAKIKRQLLRENFDLDEIGIKGDGQ